MAKSINPSSKAFAFMEALARGETIGTDNASCARFGTNQIPDLARKAREAGMPVHRELVYCEQHKTNVAKYSLPKSEQRKWRQKLAVKRTAAKINDGGDCGLPQLDEAS